MSDMVTDTHGLIWYLEDSPRLSSKASNVFDLCGRGEIIIYVPTICLLEIVYLQEKGRIPKRVLEEFKHELEMGGSNLVLVDLTINVIDAIARVPRSEVPDLPDRIIAGTALYLNLPLISRDKKIKLSNIKTIW
jgi:PIN domain nuclease of toxin-antitoxin system